MSHTRRLLRCLSLILFATCVLSVVGCTVAGRPDRPPNIVFVLVDDMGYGDLRAHGNPLIQTPNMDRLHNESMRFTNFCVSPTCAPTRAALLSGKHEFKVDVSHTIQGRNIMNAQARTVANVLQSAGYRTGHFGKWHLGLEEGYRPHERGFDVGLTVVGDSQHSHHDPTLQRNGIKEKHEGYRTDIFFDEAMKFIETHKDERFFCYIPTYSPHTPLIVPEKYSGLYDDHPRKQFLGMVTNVDENIGRLRRKISELGLEQNTVFVLMNDNGGTWGVDVHNAGMRGRKGSAMLGGIRAMSFWSWPGKWEAGEKGQTTGHIDFLPTLADVAGVELDQAFAKSLDGVSLMSLIDPQAPYQPGSAEVLIADDRMLVAHRSRWSNLSNRTAEQTREDHKYSYCSVRWKNYMLLRVQPCTNKKCGTCQRVRKRSLPDFASGRPYSNHIDHYIAPKDEWRLYDLKEDPYQSNDIAAQEPEIVRNMAAYYEQWWEEAWQR